MKTSPFLLVLLIFISSCSRVAYIVRHAEKATVGDTAAKMMTNDSPLSEAGKVRAIVLKDELHNKHIRHIYSTNFICTLSTAEPLSQAVSVPVEKYSNVDSLVRLIKSSKGNAVVVGHGDTVDDIVNKLCGSTKIDSDLKKGDYDNLFIVTFRGKKVSFSRRKYGYPSNP